MIRLNGCNIYQLIEWKKHHTNTMANKKRCKLFASVLLMKASSHIRVEIVTNINAIKVYICIVLGFNVHLPFTRRTKKC